MQTANEILRFSLVGVGLHTFDAVEDDRIGNLGIAYSVWLLNQFGSNGISEVLPEHYQKAFNFRISTPFTKLAFLVGCSIGLELLK